MLNWNGEVIFLSSKPYGENGVVASVLSENFGRYNGWVFGGNSSKKKGILQKGNYLSAEWKARLANQMGSLKLELIKSVSANFLHDPLQLSVLNSTCSISDSILPEREPNPIIYQATKDLFKVIMLSSKDDINWLKGYIKWEIGILSQLGFALELDKCAVTGLNEDLAFVSPKTGRAVSYDVGYSIKEKLLVLPTFLGGIKINNKTNEYKDIHLGLMLTAYFLKLNFFNLKNIPTSRTWLNKLLINKINNF